MNSTFCKKFDKIMKLAFENKTSDSIEILEKSFYNKH